jgi:hypothetical protein
MTHSLTTQFRTTRPGTTRFLAAKAARGGLLASAALLALGAAPAQATVQEPAGQVFADDNWLYLTVTRGDSPESDRHGTLLLCDPPKGHTRAAEACARLNAVDGDLSRLQPGDGVCTMIYSPVTVRARGEWNGRPVDYRETFSNGCVMTARTGPVFALDN